MKITVIGAGKTGRGFIGRLVNGNDITFIDKNAALVAELNAKKSFSVSFFGGKDPSVSVSGYKAYTWDEVKSIDADLIFVSVGGKNLVAVGMALSDKVAVGQKIIVAENASHPAKTLFDAIGVDGVQIAESTVFCTTIENGGIDISSESYPYLQYDASAFGGKAVGLSGIKAIDNFGNFLTRKLFTYNSASCIIAYLGYIKGYEVYSEAANDEQILAMLDENYAMINECMCREFGYEREDQAEFALLSRKKFTDPTIADTVLRNGREPQRKLTANERIVGPLTLLLKYGFDGTTLEKTLAAALLFTPDEETEWRKMLAEHGYGGILTSLCGLDGDGEVYKRIMAYAENPDTILS